MRPIKKSFKLRGLGICLVLAIVVIVPVLLWSNNINKANITNPPLRPSPAKVTSLTLDGQNFSLEYTSRYVKQTLVAKDSDLELYMLNADTSYDKHVSVAVSKLPGGQLSQNSAYSYRSTDPMDYSLTSQTVDGSSAVVATKADGSEKTIFIPRGEKIAVLSFDTKSVSDNIAAEAQQVLSSFHWK